jgi:two-component system LytT family response regulator
MRIKSIIIDDEVNNVENLVVLLNSYCPDVDIVATATSADEGKEILQKFKPDLVFLDIQMPGKNGFEILKELNELDFEVIFVTAFDKFAIQAMKFSAVDYLLKPINIQELQAAVIRAQKRHQLKMQNNQLENLINLIRSQQNKEEHRIGLTTMKETRFVKTSQVIRCESSNNYSTFYLDGGESILVCKPIYEYEELLSEYGFIRCHQSHIINKSFVKSWVKEYGGYLLLHNGTEIPVSRNKKEAVKEFLKVY